MRSRIRFTILGIVCVACILGGIFFIISAGANAKRQSSTTSSTPVATKSLDVPTEQAKRAEFVERLDASGQIGTGTPAAVRLSFPLSGNIANISVHVGESVHVGQPLAEVDRTNLAIALRQAEAGVTTASALQASRAKENLAARRLQNIRAGSDITSADSSSARSAARQAELKTIADSAALTRAKELYAAGIIAAKDVTAGQAQVEVDRIDQRTANVKAAVASQAASTSLQSGRTDVAVAKGDLATLEAQRQAAEAARESAAAAYDSGILHAPIDGVITAINKHPGETADATSPVIEITAASDQLLTLTIPAQERDLPRQGAPVDILVKSDHYAGVVQRVLPGVDVATQTARVIVACAIQSGVVGDPVRASIIVSRRLGIVVPKTSIVEDPQTGKTVIFVAVAHHSADQAAFVQRNVVVVASDATSALIINNLRVGEKIAVTGAYTLLAPSGG